MLNGVKVFVIFILLSFSSIAIADTPRVPADINEDSVVSMEEATQDLMNRFVLAFFGKRALQAFTPYSIDNIDGEISELYISPFPNFFRFLGYTFFIVSSLAFLISLFYLLYIIYDGVFKSQKSGDFLGKNWNRLFLTLKIGISLMLTVPLYSNSGGIGYNGTQYLVFYAFGKSKGTADLIIRDFSKENPTLQPDVQMPKSYASARSVSDSLLDFAMCINENHDRIPNGKSNITIEEYILNGEYQIMASKRRCKVLLSFPLNKTFESSIVSDDVLSNYFESNYSIDRRLFPYGDNPYFNYASALTRSYRNLTERLLLNSSKIMNAYMHNYRKIKHKNLTEALNDFSFSEMLAENRGGVNWYEHCPSFYSKIQNLESVGDFESLFIRVMGGNCLSYDLMSSIVLPISDLERSTILDQNRDFYLLCSNEDLITNNNTLIDLDNNCLNTYCGSLESNFSQSYLCAYTISLFDNMRKQSEYDSLGFLVFGATIYDRFSNINPQIMKDGLNNVNILFRESSRFNNSNLSKARRNNSYISRKIDLEIGNEAYPFFSRFNDRRIASGVDYPVNIPTLIEDSSGRSVNNLNIALNRVNQCVRNPLSFQGGFVCGSVIQEINKMGLSLIDIYIEYHIGRLMGVGHRKIAERSGGTTEIKKRLIGKVFNSSIARSVIGSSLAIFSSSLASIDEDEDFDYSGGGINDLFTYNNETNFATNTAIDFSNEYLRPNSVTFLGYTMGLIGFESKFLGFILTKLLITGILLAFFMPLIPFWIFIVASLNIISLMIIKTYSLCFMAALIMKPSKNHTNDALQNFTSTIFDILFKIPFLIIGLISSWLLTNIIISKIIIILDFDNLFFTQSVNAFSDSLYSLVFTVIYAIVYIFIFLKFISLTTGMIDNFSGLSNSLMTGRGYNFNNNNGIVSKLFSQTRGYIYYGSKVAKGARSNNKYSQESINIIKEKAGKPFEDSKEVIKNTKEKGRDLRDKIKSKNKSLGDNSNNDKKTDNEDIVDKKDQKDSSNDDKKKEKDSKKDEEV